MKLILLFFSFLSLNVLVGQSQQEGKSVELEVLKKKIRQSTYYDSVAVFENGARAIALARKIGSLSEEGLIYQYYGNFYYFSRRTDKAVEYYKKTLVIAKQAEDLKLENSTEIRLAFLLSDKDVLAAEKKFNSLLIEAQMNNFYENIVESCNGLGIIYEKRKIYDEAMSYYLLALKVAEKHKLHYHQAIILNNIGLIKLYNKQVEEAKVDFEKALALARKAGESRLAINLHSNLGLVNFDLKNYDEAINHYKETLKNAKILGFPTATAVAYVNLGNSLFEKKDFKNAIQYADSAIYMFSKFGEDEYLGKSYLLKASISNELGNIPAAKIAVDTVLKMNQRIPNIFNYTSTFDVLSSIYENEGNFEKALKYAKRFNQLNDSLSDISNSDKLAELQVVYGKERVEAELENVKSKNSLLEKENELKRARVRFILIISFSLLILAIASFYIRSMIITKKQQMFFSQKLIENIDEERSRISKDLHDDIGQSLSVIKSKINMYNTGRINDIEGLDSELGDVINQTRNISHHLHPAFLEKIGLARSLASLLDNIQKSTGIVCSLDLHENWENLSTEAQTQIYRIIQECINNTIKHAKASALKVSVLKQDDGYVLKYQDNGVGTKEIASQNEGIGMMTMRERGNKLNGKTTFLSTNSGFRLILKF